MFREEAARVNEALISSTQLVLVEGVSTAHVTKTGLNMDYLVELGSLLVNCCMYIISTIYLRGHSGVSQSENVQRDIMNLILNRSRGCNTSL